jgi:hypothetical protein
LILVSYQLPAASYQLEPSSGKLEAASWKLALPLFMFLIRADHAHHAAAAHDLALVTDPFD